MNGKANSFILYAENYGSKSAGRYRYGLQGELGNLGGTGAKVNLGVLISNKHQHGYNLSAEMPVGHSGTTLGLGFSRSDYELGSLAQVLGAKGVANTYSIYGRTPLFDNGKGSMEDMTLKGWGVGLAYTRPGNWFARLDYARRIGSDEFMSKEAESRGRIWFMAGKVF